MSGEWTQPYPVGHRDALIAEMGQTSLPRDRKAAIVAELEAMGSRTADADRTGMETAGISNAGVPTAGVAPGFAGRHADEGDGR